MLCHVWWRKRAQATQANCRRRTEEFVRLVAQEATPKAMSTREVEEASKNDAELNEVRDCLNGGSWDKSCVNYLPVKDELCRIGYLVLRGTRIVIPQSLRRKGVELPHQGHLGKVGTTQQLRSKV